MDSYSQYLLTNQTLDNKLDNSDEIDLDRTNNDSEKEYVLISLINRLREYTEKNGFNLLNSNTTVSNFLALFDLSPEPIISSDTEEPLLNYIELPIIKVED